jgi:hypothetical protein
MSTSLTVLARPTADQPRAFDVYWACGIRTQGVVTVRVLADISHPDVVAELATIQHLLEVEEVCGADRTGNSLSITCSLAPIRKLFLAKSPQQELVPWAAFLRTRFADAEIKVDESSKFISTVRAHARRTSIEVASPRPAFLVLPGGASLAVTHHALETYSQRYNMLSMSNAWRSLRDAVNHSATAPSAVTPAELSRHAKTIVAYDCFNGCRLICATEPDGTLTLLTTYWSRNAVANYGKFMNRRA